MKEEKSHIKYYLIKLAVCIALAVLVFIFRETLIEHLKYFIGGLMILYSTEEIIFEIIYTKRHILHGEKIYLGFIELLLGLSLLILNISYESVCVIWAIWSIMREAYEIKEIITEMKCIIPRILSAVESIAVIVFSILLILKPGEHHAMIHLYLLLVELLFSPLIPLLDELLEKKKNKGE